MKIEYKIAMDNNSIGTHIIEKKITYDNGEIEFRYRVFIPFRDGDINKVDLDKLDFRKTITRNEWEKLSPEYRRAWCNGILTPKLHKELENLRVQERNLKKEGKFMENNLMIFSNDNFGQIRSLNIDSEPWFVAKDVMEMFQATNRNRIMQELEEDEKGYTQINTPRRKPKYGNCK